MRVHEFGVLVRVTAEAALDQNGLVSGLKSLGNKRVPLAQQQKLVLRVDVSISVSP